MAYKNEATRLAAIAKRVAKEKAERDAKGLALLNELLPLPANATFEELMAIAKRMPGSNIFYPRLEKAIKNHPAFKKVVADLNTGELGRNYTYLKRPDTPLGAVNKIYKEVKERTDKAAKTLEGIYKRAGNDPAKLLKEWNNLEGKVSGAKIALTKKIRSLPEYTDFLEADEGGLFLELEKKDH